MLVDPSQQQAGLQRVIIPLQLEVTRPRPRAPDPTYILLNPGYQVYRLSAEVSQCYNQICASKFSGTRYWKK